MELNSNLFDLAIQISALLQNEDNDGYANAGTNSRSSQEDVGLPKSRPQAITSINQLFSTEEKSNNYLRNGKYDEAYELTKGLYKRGARLFFAPVLVKYFVTLMRVNRPEKAVKIRDELITLLVDNVDVTAKDIEKYGRDRRLTGHMLEAFLFYQVAERFSQNETNATDVVNALHRCCAGTASIVTKLVDKKQVDKQLIASYVIPFMRKVVSRIGRYLDSNEKEISFVQGVCLHYIEQSEYAVGDLDARESTLNEAITLFRTKLGSDAEKRHVFGGCLNNLGHTYLLRSKPKEAAKLFAQAIVAKQKAEDYDTAQEKSEDIKKSQAALGMARNQF